MLTVHVNPEHTSFIMPRRACQELWRHRVGLGRFTLMRTSPTQHVVTYAQRVVATYLFETGCW